MRGGLVWQYLERKLEWAASVQTVAKLARVQSYLANRPMLDYTQPCNIESHWDAIYLIDAVRRACKYNHGVCYSGQLAKYRRAR